MKKIWLFFLVTLFLTCLISQSIFFPCVNAESSGSTATGAGTNSDVFVGVTFGGNTTAQAKLLIDKVKGYTNLFIVDSWDISGAPNSSALTEVCDYAVNASMYFIVYFSFIYFNATSSLSSNYYNASSWDLMGYEAWHISWLSGAAARWGDKFLGVYLYDEPGGKMIDTGYWGGNWVSTNGTRTTAFINMTDYNDAAYRYTIGRQSVFRSGSMQHIINTSLANVVTTRQTVFTSDYALYWFDYLTGYDVVFTELGGTVGVGSKFQQIAMTRGAATVQGKQWGAILTWATNNPPYVENGTEMLKDMNMAYGSGARYIIVFNYPTLPNNPYGVLTDDQFNAMKTFWNEIQKTPRSKLGEVQGSVAYVLPKNYGWGMRTVTDNIWGHWPADNKSSLIWNNMVSLLYQYGPKLDIIYDDPAFNYSQDYSKIYYWNSTNIATETPDTSTSPSGNTNGSIFIIALVAIALAFVVPIVALVYKRRNGHEPTLKVEEPPVFKPKPPETKKYTQRHTFGQIKKANWEFSAKLRENGKYNQPKSYSYSQSNYSPLKTSSAIYKNTQSANYSQQSLAARTCRFCGERVRRDFNFCPNCLKKLK